MMSGEIERAQDGKGGSGSDAAGLLMALLSTVATLRAGSSAFRRSVTLIGSKIKLPSPSRIQTYAAPLPNMMLAPMSASSIVAQGGLLAVRSGDFVAVMQKYVGISAIRSVAIAIIAKGQLRLA